MKPERIQALADGIFAIAMTLLAFQIQVPELAKNLPSGEFFAGLHVIWIKAAIYAISFVVLGVYWVAHHIQFAFIRRTNLRYLWLNIVFLLFIGFVPFSAALLGSYSHQQIAILIYGTNLVLCSFSLYLNWEYAIHNKWMVDRDAVPRAIRRSANRRILGAPGFYVLGILASFIDTRLSLVLFAIPPAFSILPSRSKQGGYDV